MQVSPFGADANASGADAAVDLYVVKVLPFWQDAAAQITAYQKVNGHAGAGIDSRRHPGREQPQAGQLQAG
ncbi:MAG: hypothetical protein KDJ29_02810, partial [Hyphomicrobiales bacterium]|nr:hypothetical protein [Hyphomicrobiales bacterium]